MAQTRTHLASEITAKQIDSQITVMGWVHKRRDHGGVVFIDLRDRSGLVQLVADLDAQDILKTAETIRSEFVIMASGKVRDRPEGTINKDLASGEIEIQITDLTILNQSKALPFSLDDHQQVSEEVRLKYRYLDLRRPAMQENLKTKSNIMQWVRNYFHNNDFCEIETP